MLRKLVLIVIAFLLLLFGLLALKAVINTKDHDKARKVSSQFVQYVLDDNNSDSYALLTPDAQKNLSQDNWEETVAKLSLFFTGRKATLKNSSVNSAQQLIVSYAIPGNDGNYIFTVTLQKAGSTWLVASFESTLNQT